MAPDGQCDSLHRLRAENVSHRPWRPRIWKWAVLGLGLLGCLCGPVVRAQSYALADYWYPRVVGGEWWYDGRDWDGKAGTVGICLTSTNYALTCYTGTTSPQPVTHRVVKLDLVQNGMYGGEPYYEWDYGDFWQEYYGWTSGFTHHGFDDPEPYEDGESIRFDAVFGANLAVGQSIKRTTNVYGAGRYSGQKSMSLTLVGIASVTVPAGVYLDCLRVRFDYGAGEQIWDEWWAQGVGVVRMKGVSGSGSGRLRELVMSNDATPLPFAFADRSGAPRGSQQMSRAITVAGIAAPSRISVAGGEYSIDGGAWTTAASTVTNGQTVRLRKTASATYLAPANVVLTIGGVTDTWTVTTEMVPPDGEFSALVDAAAVASGKGWWDVTGTYGTIVAGNPLVLSLVHDTRGKLTGTAAYTVGKGTALSVPIKGSVRGGGGNVVAQIGLKGADLTGSVSLALALNLTVNAATRQLRGPMTGSVTLAGARIPVGETLTLPIPAGMDGTWTLALDLVQSPRTVTGTALLTLSNGVEYAYVAKGRSTGAELTLSLAAAADSLTEGIRASPTIVTMGAGHFALSCFSGKGYGQVVAW